MSHLPLHLLLLLVTARYTTAQPSPPSLNNGDYDYQRFGTNFNAATAILIVVVVTGFFFLAFFSVYFRRCSRDRSAVAPTIPGMVTASRRGARRGLDPAVIETFPTLTYSAVTGLKIGKEALECAVCLSEFNDDETLRMLPRCCHVFHPECIDTWLENHVTCPVCRANLSVAPSEDAESNHVPGASEESAEPLDGTSDDVAIDIGRMGRSHTTGHVMGEDRYRLRLPEHVMREIVAAGSLRRSASVAVFRGGGEGSSRRGFRGLSDRWTSGIMARVSTWRKREDTSVKKGEAGDGSVKGGMFNCLDGASCSDESGCSDGACTIAVNRV